MKQTMKFSAGSGSDATGDELSGPARIGRKGVAKFTVSVEPHTPEAAVGFDKEAVITSHGDICDRRCRLEDEVWPKQQNQHEFKKRFHFESAYQTLT